VTTRVERDFEFETGIHFNDTFYINSYVLTVSMLVETESIKEQNIALDRIVHFLGAVLHSSVFVHQDDTKAIAKYKKADMRVCTLPEEPYDQIISMVLLVKLNAITEGRLVMTDLTLGSNMSEGIRFCTVAEIAMNMIDNSPEMWWNAPALCVEHCSKEDEDDKVVKLFGQTGWAEVGLEWKQKQKAGDQSS
jgi:hypothetical protein